MRAEAYPTFFEEAVAFYAAENIAVGRWRAEEALGLSRGETEGMLSQGLETPDHHIFEIFAAVEQAPVGYVWVAAMPRHGQGGIRRSIEDPSRVATPRSRSRSAWLCRAARSALRALRHGTPGLRPQPRRAGLVRVGRVQSLKHQYDKAVRRE